MVPSTRNQRVLQRQHRLGVLGTPAMRHQLQGLSRAARAACWADGSSRRPAYRQRDALQQVALLVVVKHERVRAAGLLLVQQCKDGLIGCDCCC